MDASALERRANRVRLYQQEPKDSWPREGVEVESEFAVRSPVRARGAGAAYYSGIVGMRLTGGGVRYRCVDETCPLMYATAQGAVQHLGYRHPSARAMQRRELLNAELVGAGLPPVPYVDVTPLPERQPADALIDSVLAEAEPEPEPEATLFPTELPEAVSGSIVPPGPKRRGRPPGKRQPRDIEDTLDFMGAEVAETAKSTIDYLIESRDANRRAYREAMDELARVTAQRDHLAGVLMKIHTMTLGVETMQIGGTENGD